MTKTIDLEQYRSPGSRVFAGRGKGEDARRREGLQELDQKNGVTIEVKIPEGTLSINSSFFLGLFGDSIRTLGEGEFRKRFRFTGGRLGRVYEAAIEEATTTDSPFASV